MFLLVAISFIHIVLTGLLDALTKGNIVAFYNNNWSLMPWYFKDANFIYPASITLISLLAAILIVRKFKFSYWYFLFLIIWWLGGLESLTYWFWIAVLPINQTMWWSFDSLFFWWYPKTAPWMNRLFYLKWFSKGANVTRQGVLFGTAIAFCLNVIMDKIINYEMRKRIKKISKFKTGENSSAVF